MLFAIGIVTDKHADNAYYTTGGSPCTNAEGLTLWPADMSSRIWRHSIHDGQIDNGADNGANQNTGKEPDLSSSISGTGRNQFVFAGTDLREEGFAYQNQSQADDKQEETASPQSLPVMFFYNFFFSISGFDA